MPIQLSIIPTNLQVGSEYEHPMLPTDKVVDITFIDQASTIAVAVTIPVDALIDLAKQVEAAHSSVVVPKPTLVVPGK